MGEMRGKVALITGASSGIGAALARRFAAEGAHLAVAARRADRLEALAAELRGTGARVLPLACDVTKDGDPERAAAAARAEFGPADVVVANAGFGVGGRVDALGVDDYRRQFETNVFGVLRTVYATLDDLKQTRGRLALMGSINGYLATPGLSPYAMSKFAVRALATSLRYELLGAGVSVTHVAPGYVRSEIRQVDRFGVYHPEAPDRAPGWLAVDADVAARKIVSAIRRRRAECVITGHGKAAVWLARHTPGVVSGLVRLRQAMKRRGG